MKIQRKTTRALGRISAIALAGSLASSPVLAQEEQLASEGFGDIVVTAQTRSQKLQDVPIQVTAFSDEAIEDAGISSTQDFVNLVPNVSLDDSFTYLNSFVVVRGVTQINNADSPVAVIVDGVPQNNQKQLKMNLFDIERIEVLKGPQGGLYGRNAIGGAINIVTKGPGDRLEGILNASYGRGDAIDVSGSLSTPIGGSAGLRVAGSFKADNGRIRNSFTGRNVDFVDHDWELRGKFTTDIGSAVKLDVRAAYRKFQAGAIYDSLVVSGLASDIRAPTSNIEGLTFGNIFDASGKLDFEIGDGTLTSITAYTKIEEDYRGDLDFSNPIESPSGFLGFGFQAGQGQDLGVELTSQELRYVSDDSLPFRWILGGYYLHTKRDLQTRVFIDANGMRSQIDTGTVIVNNNESNSNDAYAVYANAEYDITDQLILSGALRYDFDERRQTNLVNGQVRRTSFDSVQPKATLTYKFTDKQLSYATYSTGFRSGGFNAPTVRIPIYRDERLENFEVGFKTSWLNNKLIVNGAIYKARSTDFQFFFIDAASAAQIIANIDKVDIWGVELEAQALVAEGFQLFGSIGTTDSNIKQNVNVPGSVGNKTPKTTSWTFNAGFQFDTPLTDNLNLLVRADYEHRGKKFWQIDNLDVQGPLDLVDLRIGIETDRWGIFLSGRNVFNEKYYADFNPTQFSGLPSDIGFRAQPGTWTIEGKIKF